MFFKKWWKKIDKLITGVVIWWALASIFWLSQKLKWKKIPEKKKWFFEKSKESFWNTMIKILNIFNKKK
jgi:F0F1-type ATP synthase membrane subunit a